MNKDIVIKRCWPSTANMVISNMRREGYELIDQSLAQSHSFLMGTQKEMTLTFKKGGE